MDFTPVSRELPTTTKCVLLFRWGLAPGLTPILLLGRLRGWIPHPWAVTTPPIPPLIYTEISSKIACGVQAKQRSHTHALLLVVIS